MELQTDNQIFFRNIFQFTARLREAGLLISLEQTIDFQRALELVNLGEREQVYFAARGFLVKRKEDLAVFDRMFKQFWRAPQPESGLRGQATPLAPRHNAPRHQPLSIATIMAQRARQEDPAVDIADKAGSYSPDEVLQRKDFSEMSPEELEAIKKLIQTIRWRVSLRQTRRRVPNRKGKYLNLRRIMRISASFGGIPIQMAWQSRKIKKRPLVILADISGSMEKYSRLLLQFCYSVAQSLNKVECFVFATRLSRITPQLRTKNIDRAIDEAARQVVDWSGGTQIGQSLHNFNRHWSRRLLRRGAVVLIVSDGWERDESSPIAQEMRYLQHRCHRLIWLNPLLGYDKYQPLVGGMAAALPYIDDFLPIHNLQSLDALGKRLANLERRRTVATS